MKLRIAKLVFAGVLGAVLATIARDETLSTREKYSFSAFVLLGVFGVLFTPTEGDAAR